MLFFKLFKTFSKRVTSQIACLVLSLLFILNGCSAYAAVENTYSENVYRFKVSFPLSWLIKENKNPNDSLRVSASSRKGEDAIIIYALKTREDGYNFRKAVNLLFAWQINMDEINKDKFIEYFEKEVVKERTGVIKSINEKKVAGVNMVDKEYKYKDSKGKIRYITKNNYAYAILLYTKNPQFSLDSQKIIDSFTYSIPSLNVWEQLTVIGFGCVVFLIIYAIYLGSGVLFYVIGLLGIWAIFKGVVGVIYSLFML